MKSTLAALLALALLLMTGATHAHGMRSAYVEIVEHASGRAVVRMRTTVEAAAFEVAVEGCDLTTTNDSELTDSGTVRGFVAQCNGPLAGRVLSAAGLGSDIEELAVRVSYADGTDFSGLILPEQPSLVLPRQRSAMGVVVDYVRLGLNHIALGADHILFLVLLVLQLRTLRDVLVVETAFSISHTISFSDNALGWVNIHPAPAEACIALSLLLVALDCRPGEKLPGRWGPALLALVFGFVHGLGFAGGLREVGVPEQSIAPALVGFGLGVEIGQVVVVLALVGLLHVARARLWTLWGERVLVYAGGGLAMYWLLVRTWLLLTSEVSS